MTDISGAIGLAQLTKINEFNKRRIENARYLNERLKGIKGVITPLTKPCCTHVFNQYTIRITHEFSLLRDTVVRKLNQAGIGSAIYYPLPIHQQPFYKSLGYSESHPIAEQLSTQVLSLPVHPFVTVQNIDVMADALWTLQG
jgi:dTDP-4-amino-4,6-dideoxygalactose transaminase